MEKFRRSRKLLILSLALGQGAIVALAFLLPLPFLPGNPTPADVIKTGLALVTSKDDDNDSSPGNEGSPTSPTVITSVDQTGTDASTAPSGATPNGSVQFNGQGAGAAPNISSPQSVPAASQLVTSGQPASRVVNQVRSAVPASGGGGVTLSPVSTPLLQNMPSPPRLTAAPRQVLRTLPVKPLVSALSDVNRSLLNR